MKRTFSFFLAAFFSFLLFGCGERDFGYKKISVGNINLTAEYYGYGKDSEDNEDVTVCYYESGDLSTFINYNSVTENKNPYVIKTSTVGSDGRSNNIIKLTLSFGEAEISKILLSIETEAEHIATFYVSSFYGTEEVNKTTLTSSTASAIEIDLGSTIDSIVVYLESPKFYSNKQLNDSFQFNYCLPYTSNGKL